MYEKSLVTTCSYQSGLIGLFNSFKSASQHLKQLDVDFFYYPQYPLP